MSYHHNPDRVDFGDNEAVFRGAIRPVVQRYFQIFANKLERGNPRSVFLDFRSATRAYPNSMVPLIVSVQRLINRGFQFECELPGDPNLQTLFLKTNWAHYLAPYRFHQSDLTHDRHLATRQFKDSTEQTAVVNDFMDVVLRTLEVDRSFVTGLEWSLNEITDNVLTHADSAVGGFVQLTVYKDQERLAFCVADGGRGILASLREAIPTLKADTDAIEDAVRVGVTRNRDIGQGNGLSGTLNIAMGAKGRFLVASGSGWMAWQDGHPESRSMKADRQYKGTCIDVQLPLGQGIDLAASLTLGSKAQAHFPSDIIELKHLSEDAKKLTMKMSDETAGFGSRPAGLQVHTKARNLLNAETECLLEIDWDGIQVISSSYADEFIGKLFVYLGPTAFMSRIRQINMMPVIRQLIDKAVLQRVAQVMADSPETEGDNE